MLIKGEEERELLQTAFKGGYLPAWQFDIILMEHKRLSEALQKAEEYLEYFAGDKEAKQALDEIKRIKEGK